MFWRIWSRIEEKAEGVATFVSNYGLANRHWLSERESGTQVVVARPELTCFAGSTITSQIRTKLCVIVKDEDAILFSFAAAVVPYACGHRRRVVDVVVSID